MFLHKLKMRFKKPKKVVSLQIVADKCVGCGVCVEKCKRDVFILDKTEKRAVVFNIAECVGCGKCVTKMCKFGAIDLIIEENGKEKNF